MQLTRILACSVTVAALCAIGAAQTDTAVKPQDDTRPAATAQDDAGNRARGEGRQRQRRQVERMSPEQAKSVWTWQAKDIAHELDLSGDQSEKLVAAYIDGREELSKAIRTARAQRSDTGDRPRGQGNDRGRDERQPGQARQRGARGGGSRGGFGAYGELVDEYRAALETRMTSFLPAEQMKQASAVLGTYNPQWDRMTGAIVGLELPTEKTFEALGPVRGYVAKLADMADLRAEGADWQDMRGIMTDARENLVSQLGEVLDEEQMKKFQAATRRGRGGDRPRRQRDRADDNKDDTVLGPKIGEPAPNFALMDAEGNTHSLAGQQGNIVVLQWINPDCPYCKGAHEGGKVTKMKKALDEIDDSVVVLAINSTHYMEPGAGAEYMKRNKLDTPVLIDSDGKIGHLYNAKTTPHMFVIDNAGILRYNGAIDDDARGRKDEATNYVVQAVRQIVDGDTVTPDTTKSYGCSVKYAK